MYNKTLLIDKTKNHNRNHRIPLKSRLKTPNFKIKFKIIIFGNRNKKSNNHTQLTMSKSLPQMKK